MSDFYPFLPPATDGSFRPKADSRLTAAMRPSRSSTGLRPDPESGRSLVQANYVALRSVEDLDKFIAQRLAEASAKPLRLCQRGMRKAWRGLARGPAVPLEIQIVFFINGDGEAGLAIVASKERAELE